MNNKNIIVVATKLKKDRKDEFKNDWRKSIEFRNIQEAIQGNPTLGEFDIPILPLKASLAYDQIFEKKITRRIPSG